MKKVILLYVCVFSSLIALSQNPTTQDCAGAIQVTQSSYYFPNGFSGNGNIPDEIPSGQNCPNHCLHYGEKNSVWFRVEIQQSGTFGFLITPNSSDTDFDWAVYDITNSTCDDLYLNSALQRSCNVSAETGTTGATGYFLDCQGIGGQPYNNFITVDSGEVYVIIVNNFSDNQDGFTIEFDYSATSIDVYSVENQMSVYPNPVDDVLHIHLNSPCKGDFEVLIYDVTGQLVMTEKINQQENSQIAVELLPVGLYVIKLVNPASFFHSVFIKQ